MDLNKQKEQFSIAYARAVIAVAGFNIYRMEVDEDSVDLGVAATGDRDLERGPKLDIQLKCTSGDVVRESEVVFPLKRKNYDDLRKVERLTMQILLVVVVPYEVVDWLKHSEESLLLRRCGYWDSLMGRAATNNTESVTVRIPRQQQFTPEALQNLMRRINDKELP
jgi:hypothetical protein